MPYLFRSTPLKPPGFFAHHYRGAIMFKKPNRRTIKLEDLKASRLAARNRRRAIHGLKAIQSYASMP